MITRNQKINWHTFCSEPLELVENYQQALAEGFKGWCMHHKLEIQPDGTIVSMQELKDKNLYYGRPANELVFMRNGEHMTLHNNNRSYDTRKKLSEASKNRVFSKDTCEKISNALKDRIVPEITRQKMSEARKGKHRSEETRKKISNKLKGKVRSQEHCRKISIVKKGIHWWNNGIEMKMSRECPGEGWKRGRLKVSTTSV